MNQRYEPLAGLAATRGRYVQIYTCCGCGSIVHNMARHDDWHHKFDKTLVFEEPIERRD